ncbi:MAG TPA: hypothetical protein VFE53_20125 [Mucilaginibacter sp.]|jgi:hypothetical protein|nr:hypothetical protein [Mucilaginibacter sp.]
MHIFRYPLSAGKNSTSFQFISVGPKGNIKKLIYFTPTYYPNFYNLSFGDENPQTGKLDDLIISNNGDSENVLATVVSAVYAFTYKHPDAWVAATGSTDARTRLYRMGLSKHFEKLNEDFYVLGQYDDSWEPFVIGKDYEAFVVKRK